ncbi:MAG TPA: hypothetical protein PLU22_01295 [Polyangiaceae bacterium]|nr:hypothetical protein [Polyangiaceae bacterium]
MLGLTGGEAFLVAFLAAALISARWWPRLGAYVARRLAGGEDDAKSPPRPGAESAGD